MFRTQTTHYYIISITTDENKLKMIFCDVNQGKKEIFK